MDLLGRFVSVFQTYIETTETNRIVSKRTETTQKKPKDDLSQTAAEGAGQVNSFGKEY